MSEHIQQLHFMTYKWTVFNALNKSQNIKIKQDFFRQKQT